MKMRSVKYLVGEGFRSTWVNRLMSLASIGVLVACMTVIGLAILIAENANKVLGNLEQQNVVMVYMKDYNWALYNDSVEKGKEGSDKNGVLESDYFIHNEDEAKALCAKLEQLPNVTSAEYISSEQGLESVKENMTEEQEQYFSFLDDDYGNPLSAAAKVTMKDMSKFKETISSIEGTEGVDIVQSQGDLAEKITAIKRGVGIAGGCIIAILVIISLVIVSNTIRVTMYNRKLEISIMKAVGATDSFVRLPFAVEGMFIGVISAIISEVLLYFCYRIAIEAIAKTLGTTDVVHFRSVAVYIFLVFLLIGIFAGLLGSIIMIGKYLRKEGSEFTAL